MSSRIIPIKTHIKFLEDEVEDLKTVLHNNRKDRFILRGENVILDNISTDNCKILIKDFISNLSIVQNILKDCELFQEEYTNQIEIDLILLNKEKMEINLLMRNCEETIVELEKSLGVSVNTLNR